MNALYLYLAAFALRTGGLNHLFPQNEECEFLCSGAGIWDSGNRNE